MLWVSGMRKLGKPRKLLPWQASFLRRAWRLRRKLTDKALAHRFGICETTVHTYIGGRHKG